jgi:hypothetical protein
MAVSDKISCRQDAYLKENAYPNGPLTKIAGIEGNT